MDWYPPRATWMACCAGTLAHMRMLASRVRPSRKSAARCFGPDTATQPER